MKKSNSIVSFICVLVLTQFMSCQKPDDILGRHFNKSEVQNIEQIIDYFDAYVLKHMGNQLPIDKAYHAYFDDL